LVTEPIGTSRASSPDHMLRNMSRETMPCSLDTPLARWASRRPMCAMLNMPGFSSAPSARIRDSGTPDSRPWPDGGSAK
jgi:hypothetical protein